MGSFDGKEEVVHLRKKRLLSKVASGVFFFSSLVFLVVYLSLPQSRASSLVISSDLKGQSLVYDPTNPSSESYINENDVLSGMGVNESTYSSFVDVKNAEENLLKAPFVSDKIRPLVTKSPFSLNVSFADLFPIVSIDSKNYLTDGTMYPYSGIDQTDKVKGLKQDWVLNHYPSKEEIMVPFVEDPSLGEDHSTSIPYLFYVWDFLTQKDLKGVRYEANKEDYLFYWVKDDGFALRLRIRKALLNIFGRPNYLGKRNYQEPIYSLGNTDFDERKVVVIDKTINALDGNYPSSFVSVVFAQESVSGEYSLTFDKEA